MLGQGGDEETGGKMKRMLYITDSMTREELDSDGSLFTAPIDSPSSSKAEVAEKISKELTKQDGEKDKKKKKAPVKVRMTGRARRVAKGSGTSVREVEEFLVQYKMVAGMVKKMGGKQGWLKQMQGAAGGRRPGGVGGGMPALPPGVSREQIMQMQNSLPPDIKAQLRQPGGREKLLQQIQSGNMPPGLTGMPGMGGMGGGGGFPGLGALGNMFGGGGGGGPGGGGMPDMAQMQQMMSQMGGMGGLQNMMKGMMGGGGGAGAGR